MSGMREGTPRVERIANLLARSLRRRCLGCGHHDGDHVGAVTGDVHDLQPCTVEDCMCTDFSAGNDA